MQVQADSGKSGAEKNVRNEGVALGAFAVSGAGEKRTWPRRHGLAKYELWGAVWTAGKRHICTTERSLALVWVLSGLGFVWSGFCLVWVLSGLGFEVLPRAPSSTRPKWGWHYNAAEDLRKQVSG